MKVLMVCKELYTYPMSFIGEGLVAADHEVAAVFIHYSESILRNHSYTSFRERNETATIFSFDDEITKYWSTFQDADHFLDHVYLKNVEKRYCVDTTFGELMMSSQMFTTQYHTRFYFRDLTEGEKLYWVQLVFRKVEKLLDEYQPDEIIDIDNSEFGRSVLMLVANERRICYTTLESSRYESTWLPTYTLGRKTDAYFKKAVLEAGKETVAEVPYLRKVRDFREQDSIYKHNATSTNSGQPLLIDIRQLLSRFKNLFIQWKDNRSYFHVFKRVPLIASLWDAYYYFLLGFLRKRYIFSSLFKYFENPVESERYVYFPLHLIPESTTLIKSPYYPNEITVIEALSKSLPLGCKLYVKEHGAMVGERPISFYRHLSRFSNIRLVKMDYYSDPKPWIQNSIGVVTLSGSSAFEAAMLGKKSLIFGNTFFELIEGVGKVSAFQELPKKLKEFETVYQVSEESCAAYIQAVCKLGAYVPMAQLINETRKATLDRLPLSPEMTEVIKNLTHLLLVNYEASN